MLLKKFGDLVFRFMYVFGFSRSNGLIIYSQNDQKPIDQNNQFWSFGHPGNNFTFYI